MSISTDKPIKSVTYNGVEIPLVGGGGEYELIAEHTVDADTANIQINTDLNGNAFQCTDIVVFVDLYRADTSSNVRMTVFSTNEVWDLVYAASTHSQGHQYVRYHFYRDCTGRCAQEIICQQYENSVNNVQAGVGKPMGDALINKVNFNKSDNTLFFKSGTKVSVYGIRA